MYSSSQNSSSSSTKSTYKLLKETVTYKHKRQDKFDRVTKKKLLNDKVVDKKKKKNNPTNPKPSTPDFLSELSDSSDSELI